MNSILVFIHLHDQFKNKNWPNHPLCKQLKNMFSIPSLHKDDPYQDPEFSWREKLFHRRQFQELWEDQNPSCPHHGFSELFDTELVHILKDKKYKNNINYDKRGNKNMTWSAMSEGTLLIRA